MSVAAHLHLSSHRNEQRYAGAITATCAGQDAAVTQTSSPDMNRLVPKSASALLVVQATESGLRRGGNQASGQCVDGPDQYP